MMVFTTIFLASFVIGLLYCFVVRNIKWPAASYAIIVIVGLLCLFEGSVHFRYVGIEVLGLGSLIVWLHYRYWKKVNTPSPKTA
jgi:hypothetical protein